MLGDHLPKENNESVSRVITLCTIQVTLISNLWDACQRAVAS